MSLRILLLPVILFFSITSFSQDLKWKDSIPVKDTVYQFVDSMPQYPGGMSEMLIYIMTHLKWPTDHEDIQGTVYLSFIVEINGAVSDVKIIKGIPGGTALELEAIRIVKTFPKWKPGMQNGKPVRVKYNIPIRFRH